MLVLVCVIEPVYPISQLSVCDSDEVLQVAGAGAHVFLFRTQPLSNG